ncbi:metal-sensing transcriptional repressor [Neptunicoccus cionae]|uniref:Metal resistance protein n=1 Tax=Neptunicoccus cionae TaxID=2035344 RepID=A0A916QT53_9RHOB|nr:metal-sensing transcriptional repressor [Amylibacter cionae]GGA08846.1 metal resistance protein [Amylibacter cionae]
MSDSHVHATHPALITRLKRADGHLRAVIGMIEAGRPCLEIVQQMQAVEKAITNAKRALIHDHMDHCLDTEDPATDREELRAIARYL